ncbi:MAG: pyridoxamine 5'-phosphate oxidase family protein, partial [Gemmatimonadaceae bacterium]|nr:pyridoxamine 5'-phosphate oxidase family protein [Acetobacteraceae bacterium]
QHRAFFEMLPYVFMGSLDEQGRPWASILSGAPGFLQSPDPRRLSVTALPLRGDPARHNLHVGAPVAFVGVELHTRRRNRLTGKIERLDGERFAFRVDQSFGNCPQYIQARAPTEAPSTASPVVRVLGSSLDDRAAGIVSRSDTLFIASASPGAGTDDPVEGVDVNHRGGRPGFVCVKTDARGSVLTFPDFVGNSAFNTLGNIALNPRAGLLFVDFQTGDLVTLTGQAEVIWDGPELQGFVGAERLVRVHVEEAHHLVAALPWRWTAPEQAPQLPATGDWRAVAMAEAARTQAHTDRRFRVARVQAESPTVRSLDLEPADGGGVASYEPGQHLPVAIRSATAGDVLRRTYSLSKVADGDGYRISVRREPGGSVSAYLHEAKVGTEILVQAPRGSFRLDPDSQRPVLLIGGGIGITPLLAMAEFLTGGTDDRLRFPDRPVHLIHAVRNGADHPFRDRLRDLARSRGNLTCFFAYSAPRAEDRPGKDYQVAGRLGRSELRALLPLDEYDAYLCGPPAFVQAVYDALISLGVADRRIFGETFGPSVLRRAATAQPREHQREPAVAGAAVTFAATGKTALWQPGSTLLDLAEAAGIDAPWSCRSGRCGTCARRLVEGHVTYPDAPEFAVEPGQVLICQAEPADAAITLDL